MFPRAVGLRIVVSATLFLGFLILPISGVAQSDPRHHHPTVLQGLKNLQERSRSSPNVAWYQDGQRVRTLNGNLSGPIPGTTGEAATKFVRDNTDVFRLEPTTSDLSVEDVRETGIAGKVVNFKQHYSGLPVFDGGLQVYVNADNSVHLVHNYYVPDLHIDTRPALSAAQAIKIAENDLSKNCIQPRSKIGQPVSCEGQRLELARAPSIQLGVFESRLAYRFTLDVDLPRLLTEYTIDANDGQILESLDRIRRAQGGGTVFDPSPVSPFHTPCTDKSNNNCFSWAYIPRNLLDITFQTTGNKNSYTLKGPYVDVTDSLEAPFNFSKTSGRVVSSDGNFNFARSANEFEHVMVYYHIDTNQRYIQSLGFTNINNRPILVDPHGLNGADNSYYLDSPVGAGYLAFGKGNVDHAEDADIILHEYGHAILNNQAPGMYKGCTTESGAMDEGFGDYWAASSTFSMTLSNGLDPACLADWYSAPGCLRRLDSTKHYPEAKTGECHADGEIWSAVLWEILSYYGGTYPDKVILQSHFLVPSGPTFQDGALALLQADQQINNGGGHRNICTIMRKRGILDPAVYLQCAWEPWGSTLYDNNIWFFFSSPTDTPVLPQPAGGIFSLDTRLPPPSASQSFVELKTGFTLDSNGALQPIVDTRLSVTKMIIGLKASAQSNVSYPETCTEFGKIGIMGPGSSPGTAPSVTVAVTTSTCQVYNVSSSLFNDGQWTTYEIPLTGFNGPPTGVVLDAFTNAGSFFVMDIDYIDFR